MVDADDDLCHEPIMRRGLAARQGRPVGSARDHRLCSIPQITSARPVVGSMPRSSVRSSCTPLCSASHPDTRVLLVGFEPAGSTSGSRRAVVQQISCRIAAGAVAPSGAASRFLVDRSGHHVEVRRHSGRIHHHAVAVVPDCLEPSQPSWRTSTTSTSTRSTLRSVRQPVTRRSPSRPSPGSRTIATRSPPRRRSGRRSAARRAALDSRPRPPRPPAARHRRLGAEQR